MRWLTARQRWHNCWFVLSLASAVAGCTHPMPTDAPVVDRVLGDQVLREQLVTRGTLEEHFVHEVLYQLGQGPNGDQNSLDSSPIISTTTRSPLTRSMGNLLDTKAFKSGSLSKPRGKVSLAYGHCNATSPISSYMEKQGKHHHCY